MYKGLSVRCLCKDGKVRMAQVTAQEPDTFFSISARVRVKGISVSGFIMGIDYPEDYVDGCKYSFTAYRYGKNWGKVGAEL
jgi:hypothetical protein